MSLLNVHVTAERALVAVDTDGIDCIGTVGHFNFSKLLHLVSTNVVLAGQGDRRFLLDAFAMIFLAQGNVDYDVIVDSFPGMLAKMASGARQQGAPDIRYSLAVVGFSPKEERICGRWYEGVVTSDQFEIVSLGSRISPWESQEKPPIPDSVENNIELAREQTAFHKTHGHAGGGKLILAELTHGGMTIRHVCDLG